MAKRGIATGSEPLQDKYLQEIEAQRQLYLALKDVDKSAQLRILRSYAEMLGMSLSLPSDIGPPPDNSTAVESSPSSSTISSDTITDEQESDGINPVALRWIRRIGFSVQDLQSLFSLGIDEIDLVAKTVPGKSVRERLRNVLLLKGAAAYLSTGAARVPGEQLREAALHYKAYDQPNFAKHMKSLASEVGGNKSSGYTLTARGLSSATELIQQLLVRK